MNIEKHAGLEHTGTSPHFEQRVLDGLTNHSHSTVFLATTVLEAMLTCCCYVLVR